ncbi:MAG TPA: elongation factor G [Opitutaceae bacterium]|nr:elongation factor G [Opitutaceae bacterium]
MKEYAAHEIRNFAVVGHSGAGKTMLCEAMLACSGAIPKVGSIAQKTTVSDYHAGEHEHLMSLHTTCLHTEWLGKKLNILDCPGYADFAADGLGALRVGDFALLAIHGVHGLQVGTDQAWNFATKFGLPKMIVVNALDKENTRFDEIVEEARAHFGPKVFPLSLPLNAGPYFNRVLDVMRSEVVTYATDGSGKFKEEAVSGPLADKVRELHKQVVELIAESDDTLMTKFFDEGGTLTEDELRAGIHTAIQSGNLVPLFAVSAEKDIGVARLLDIIAKYGSSPVDRAKVAAHDATGAEVEVKLDRPEAVIHVFKTLVEQHVGELSFFRVYSGTVTGNMELYNASRKTSERLGQLQIANGKTRTPVAKLGAGDIGCVLKLRDTHTGNTLCSPGLAVELPKIDFPKPKVHAAIVLKVRGEEDKLATGLNTLHEEDPTFTHRYDPEIRQHILSGQGDMHLQVVAERLKRRFNVAIELAEPRIPYRETIRGKGESKYRHKKQTGGSGQFAEVWMRIEPKERDGGVEFTESLVGQNVDRVFVPSVEKGVKTACGEGILAHFHVTDVKIEFYDGKMHPVDSNDVSFQVAGYWAFKEAFAAARPCLIEPIFNVEVQVPEEFIGAIMGDISSRRGKILGVDSDGAFQVVKAVIPQKELAKYSTVLRALTGGRANHTESFGYYQEMPAEFEKAVIEERKRQHAAEHNGH